MSNFMFLEDEQTCSGFERNNSAFIKLISCDGHEFFIKRKYAIVSGTIKSMLSCSEQFCENECDEIFLRKTPSVTRFKVF